MQQSYSAASFDFTSFAIDRLTSSTIVAVLAAI